MTRIAIKRPRAILDILEQADYIARDSPSGAERFIDSVEATCDVLLGSPSLGSPWETDNSRYHNLRYWPVQGFPNHLIFFGSVRNGIEILRVCHAGRDLDNVLGTC